MSKLLESIWYDYISQQPAELSQEMRALREELNRSNDLLWGDLNNTQKEEFLEFESCMNRMTGAAEKRCLRPRCALCRDVPAVRCTG